MTRDKEDAKIKEGAGELGKEAVVTATPEEIKRELAGAGALIESESGKDEEWTPADKEKLGRRLRKKFVENIESGRLDEALEMVDFADTEGIKFEITPEIKAAFKGEIRKLFEKGSLLVHEEMVNISNLIDKFKYIGLNIRMDDFNDKNTKWAAGIQVYIEKLGWRIQEGKDGDYLISGFPKES